MCHPLLSQGDLDEPQSNRLDLEVKKILIKWVFERVSA